MPKKALITVSDKSGLDQWIPYFNENDVEVISTGGTLKYLKTHGLDATPIEEVTGNPEILSGRVKTLGFKIAGGILFRRESAEDVETVKTHGLPEIDLLICNLYPFEQTFQNLLIENQGDFKDSHLDQLIEKIDIGGPTLLRSAVKNHKSVAVVIDPKDYSNLIKEYSENGELPEKTKRELALKAIAHTAEYDSFISKTLEALYNDSKVRVEKWTDGEKLRYGENPHQSAVFYPSQSTDERFEVISGKEPSYNNYLDMNAAFDSVRSFSPLKSPEKISEEFKNQVAVSVIKHAGPCGLSLASDSVKAFDLAWEGDPISAFGSTVCFTHKLESDILDSFKGKFVEIVMAPDFSDDVVRWFKEKKPNLRLVKCPEALWTKNQGFSFKSIWGGVLTQEADEAFSKNWEQVTKNKFPEELIPLGKFAEITGRLLKSNAISICRKTEDGSFQMIGAGQGQPNRVESLEKLAIPRAKEKDNLEKAVLYSDAFFPFRDSIEMAHSHGVKYIVQPGGSKRDQEVVDACDEFGVSMIFTGMRHFNH
jgi:phosphoribosylaminoimidazolecarboxamide formyltransferase/IMP cyclohydrolase